MRELEAQRPTDGVLQAPGVAHDVPYAASIDEMAEDYVNAIGKFNRKAHTTCWDGHSVA